jgi:hypothetical protein
MERRNRSLGALKELVYIDSLDDELRASLLDKWVTSNLVNFKIEDFDLELAELKKLHELFYKNITFMKKHRTNMKLEIDNYKKIREFLT